MFRFPPHNPFQSETPVIQASPEVARAEDNLELVLQSPTQVPRLLLRISASDLKSVPKGALTTFESVPKHRHEYSTQRG